MDIDLEKEKARYAYKLEMRKLVIDKVLIGIIVAVVGWQINIAFERYKNQLGTERFLLEKRLEAVSAVRNTYSQLHDMYIDLTTADTKGKIHLPNDYKQKYDNVRPIKILHFFRNTLLTESTISYGYTKGFLITTPLILPSETIDHLPSI